jgi:hypothetical protein
MSNAIVQAAAQLVWQLPPLLVYVIGITLAVSYWRWQPTVCLLTLLANGLMLGAALVQTVGIQYLVHIQNENGGGFGSIGMILSAIGLVCNLVRAVGLGLLLAAVFHGRVPTSKPVSPYDMP